MNLLKEPPGFKKVNSVLAILFYLQISRSLDCLSCVQFPGLTEACLSRRVLLIQSEGSKKWTKVKKKLRRK